MHTYDHQPGIGQQRPNQHTPQLLMQKSCCSDILTLGYELS